MSANGGELSDVARLERTATAPERSRVSHTGHNDGSNALVRTGADRYSIVGEHARGGIGRVLCAHDLQVGRDVAVKELLEESRGAETRFLREALITARLEHPGIVPVHEVGRRSDGTLFYSMKLIAGDTLKQLIAGAHSRKDRLRSLPNVIAVARAVAYAHSKGACMRARTADREVPRDSAQSVVARARGRSRCDRTQSDGKGSVRPLCVVR